MKSIPLYEIRKIKSIKELLDSSAVLFSERTAFLMKQKGNENYVPVTYTQYKADVDALGTALHDLGLKSGRVAIISENRYEWAISYMAVLNGTGIVVPLDKDLPENEIENLLIRSKADAVLFSANCREHILGISKRIDFIKHYIDMDKDEDKDKDKDKGEQEQENGENNFIPLKSLITKGMARIAAGCRDFIDAQIDTEVMSILLFTSATTDKSKAVMLSHRNLSENLMAMSAMINIVPADIFLSILPLHHTYENTCGFLCPIYRGATVAYCEGLRHIQKNLQESKATVMLGVPLIFESIYKRIWDQAAKKPEMLKKLKFGLNLSNLLKKLGIDISRKIFSQIHNNFGGNLRLFISGAAGIDPEVAKGFRSFGLNFLQGYGLTECSPIVALNRDVDFRDNAAGLPLPGLDIRIENPGADGNGEISVTGPSVMLGYFEDPVNTAKILKDGRFYTGDLGYMDNAEFVYITGRKKNVIVTKNGKNIYPEEIETMLGKSPFIKESLVFGKDDEVYGDIVVSATIVPEMEAIQAHFGDHQPTPEEVYDLVHREVKAVNKSLAIYKYIKDFNLRNEEFTKTTSKKIKRYEESR
jgi:long-chain acyl-CoA synthetase